jgi:hypothetical protein
MASTLSYEMPSNRRPSLVERFDAPGQMTLIVHPSPRFSIACTVMIGIVVISTLCFIAPIFDPEMLGPKMANVIAFSFAVFILGVVGFLVAWNAARTRITFQLFADRLYVVKVGPLARSQQLWARDTVTEIAVYKFHDPADPDDPPLAWHYQMRLRSTYRGRNYVHIFLSDREGELLRTVANELRHEFGWPPQQPGDELEDKPPSKKA